MNKTANVKDVPLQPVQILPAGKSGKVIELFSLEWSKTNHQRQTRSSEIKIFLYNFSTLSTVNVFFRKLLLEYPGLFVNMYYIILYYILHKLFL